MLALFSNAYTHLLRSKLCQHNLPTPRGWSGLVACKYMSEEGLSVVAIEKREDIGGVWRYSDDPSIPIIMKSTCCTSSSLPGAAMGYQNMEE